MKKTLLAAAVAVTFNTAANASSYEINYDVTMTSVISGGMIGTQTGTGHATLFVEDGYGIPTVSYFKMTVDGSSSAIYFSQTLLSDFSTYTEGTFDYSQLHYSSDTLDGLTAVTACSDYSTTDLPVSTCEDDYFSGSSVGSTSFFLAKNSSVDNNYSTFTFNNTVYIHTSVSGYASILQSFVLEPNNQPSIFTAPPEWKGAPVSEIPVPAAAWLFGSALVGLIGINRKRQSA